MFDLTHKTLSRVFELSQDILSIHSADGKWLNVSSTCKNILGYSKESLIGKDISEFIHENDYPIIEDALYNMLQTLKGQTVTYRIKHKEGQYLWLKTTAHFEKIEGDPIIIAFSRDITPLKKAELRIQDYNRQLEATIQSRDKFISILSHDMRSPLQAVMGLSQILSENILDLSDDKISFFARNINISTVRLNSLLTNLIDWSKSKNGVLTCNPEKFNISKIIEAVLDLYKDQIDDKHLKINYTASANTTVLADEQMSRSIFRNLLSNAIKFSNSDSSIDIICRPDGDRTHFQISDHGIGMTPNTIKKLFSDSPKINSGTKGETGSGIGLSLCKDFIEKHNCSMKVDSEPGKGTTFYFELPR